MFCLILICRQCKDFISSEWMTELFVPAHLMRILYFVSGTATCYHVIVHMMALWQKSTWLAKSKTSGDNKCPKKVKDEQIKWTKCNNTYIILLKKF